MKVGDISKNGTGEKKYFNLWGTQGREVAPDRGDVKYKGNILSANDFRGSNLTSEQVIQIINMRMLVINHKLYTRSRYVNFSLSTSKYKGDKRKELDDKVVDAALSVVDHWVGYDLIGSSCLTTVKEAVDAAPFAKDSNHKLLPAFFYAKYMV